MAAYARFVANSFQPIRRGSGAPRPPQKKLSEGGLVRDCEDVDVARSMRAVVERGELMLRLYNKVH
jgi:hypothetical protein